MRIFLGFSIDFCYEYQIKNETIWICLCKNNNPLMENRVWKGQISSTYVSLIPELWA